MIFLSSSHCLEWKLDSFENVGSSVSVFHCSRDYICFLHFCTWQRTEQYKKYLRILPVLPLTKRLPFCIWNVGRQESIFAGQSSTTDKVQVHPFFPHKNSPNWRQWTIEHQQHKVGAQCCSPLCCYWSQYLHLFF